MCQEEKAEGEFIASQHRTKEAALSKAQSAFERDLEAESAQEQKAVDRYNQLVAPPSTAGERLPQGANPSDEEDSVERDLSLREAELRQEEEEFISERESFERRKARRQSDGLKLAEAPLAPAKLLRREKAGGAASPGAATLQSTVSGNKGLALVIGFVRPAPTLLRTCVLCIQRTLEVARGW